MIYLKKRRVTGEMKLIKSETLDPTIASFFYENAFAFNVADSPSFVSLVDQCQPYSMDTAYPYEHSIFHNPAARCPIQHCVPAPRVCTQVQRRMQARDTARAWRAVQNEILEHFSPVL